ncbi:MAG: ABC transporter ATP-binding protein [Candidatus Methylacidiphilales bacterium]
MIKIENLSKKFGKLQALNNISIQCNKGECIALIGPNGCGKTTLIKTILGMVVPNSGNIYFNNNSILNDVDYRKHIGYMPQIGHYPENMTIGQIIDMIKSIRKHNGEEDNELLAAYQLKSFYDKKMRTLSGGTTQKVSATIAFMFNPDVLILDEPTAGLDPLAAEILKEKIIKEKEKGKLIFITSHLLSELDDLVSNIIFMQDGNIKFNKNTTEIKNITQQPTISKAITQILKTGIYE